MSPDKDRSVTRALRFLQRGEVDLAIKSYLDALNLNKNDTRILMRLAALFVRNNDLEKALDYYMQAADQYSEHGYFEKAISAYRQALKLDQRLKSAHQSIAELYLRLNNVSKSLSQYKELVLLYEEEGRLWEAIEVMEKMKHLDQNNSVIAAKLADLYFKNGMKVQGYHSIRPVIASFRAQGEDQHYQRLLEMVAKADPDNTANLKELADFYLEKELGDDAYNTLLKVHKKDPKDIETLRQLADVALALGRPGQSVSSLKELKSLYEEKGLKHRAKSAAREILEIMPHDEEAKSELGPDGIMIEMGDDLIAAETEPEPIELVDMVELRPGLPEAVPIPEHERLLPPAVPGADLPRFLETARLILKFGVKGDPFFQVQIDLAQDSRDVKARVSLKDAHLECGIREKTIHEFEDVVGKFLRENSIASVQSLLMRLFEEGLQPAQALVIETERKEEVQAPREEVDQTIAAFGEDDLEHLEKQFLDLYQAAAEEPEPAIPETELETPEGYELDGYVQDLLEYYGARYLAQQENRTVEEEIEVPRRPPAPPPEQEESADDGLEPAEGYKLDGYVQKLLDQYAAKAAKESRPGGESALEAKPEAGPDRLPGSPLCRTAVYCPFLPVAELMAETSAGKRESEELERATVYTMALNGRYISLVGPAPEDALVTLRKMMASGVRNVILLDLCGGPEDEVEKGSLLVPVADSGAADEPMSRAIARAAKERSMEFRLVPASPDQHEDSPDRAVHALSLSLVKAFALASENGAGLGCLMVAADGLSAISRDRALPSDVILASLWRACYVAIDAAFDVSGP
jgi:tetratricopeptide (TPR) repeat protein